MRTLPRIPGARFLHVQGIDFGPGALDAAIAVLADAQG